MPHEIQSTSISSRYVTDDLVVCQLQAYWGMMSVRLCCWWGIKVYTTAICLSCVVKDLSILYFYLQMPSTATLLL